MWLGPQSLLNISIIDCDDRYRSRSKAISVIIWKLKLISSIVTMNGASLYIKLSVCASQLSTHCYPFVLVARFTLLSSRSEKLVPRVAYFIYEHLSKLAVI